MKTLIDFVKDIDADIDRRKEYLEKERVSCIEKAENTMLFLQEANSLGMSFPEPSSFYGVIDPTFRITEESENPKWKKEWHIIKKIVGDLDEYSKEPYGDDARKRLVMVTLAPKDERFAHIKFKFVKKLPPGKKAKCRMVRVQPASYLTMVCEDE